MKLCLLIKIGSIRPCVVGFCAVTTLADLTAGCLTRGRNQHYHRCILESPQIPQVSLGIVSWYDLPVAVGRVVFTGRYCSLH